MHKSLFALLALLGMSSHAATPDLEAARLPVAPVIDGRVADDAAWTTVAPASGFQQVRPYEGQPASQRTDVYVGFDDTTLYIGVMLFDDAPQTLVVGDSRRDTNLDDIDSFRVLIDGFLDRQNGFVFGTAPSGVEYDGQVIREGEGGFGSSGGGFNLNWDTSWEVATQVHDRGWSAEMAIPFRSLRYGAGQTQTWGINFQRNIARNNEVAYWAPLPRQYNLQRVSLAGTLRGVEVPVARSLKITPYVLGQARRGGNLASGTHFDEEVGFDAKFSITPSLTLDATYNTDFAQVEVDEQQVDLNRFSLFFPEKRPFFLENAGQFSVGSPREVELFFSRRIGIDSDGVQQPIDAGVRLSGKVGARTNIGLLHMLTRSDEGTAPANDFSVLRINQELGNRSSIGGIIVSRDGERSGDYNRTYALDGQWGIGEDWTLTAYSAQTETPGRRGDDRAHRIRANYNSETWIGASGYTSVGENFNPEVGFLRRSNYEKGDFFVLRRIRPEDWFGILELRPHISFNGWWDHDGYFETGFLHVDNHWEWRNGYEIHTGVNFLHEGVRTAFEINPGTFVEPGEYDHHEVDFVLQTDDTRPLSFDTAIKIGGYFGGHRKAVDSTLRYRFRDRFSSELVWSHNDLDLPFANGDFKVNVGRLRLTYAFTPKVQLQALVQYDNRTDLVGTNIRFSWLQSANAGLYLVYNEIDDETVVGPIEKRRELVLKYSRIIDLL